MISQGSQRKLRRAVADLLQNPIEDIELVWNMLSAEEREQLGPIVSAASNLNEQASARLNGVESSRLPKLAVDAEQHHSRLVHQIEAMPVGLAARLFGSLDRDRQHAIAARLPNARLRAIQETGDMTSVTAYACEARLKVCLDASRDAPVGQSHAPKQSTHALSYRYVLGAVLGALRTRFGYRA